MGQLLWQILVAKIFDKIIYLLLGILTLNWVRLQRMQRYRYTCKSKPEEHFVETKKEDKGVTFAKENFTPTYPSQMIEFATHHSRLAKSL